MSYATLKTFAPLEQKEENQNQSNKLADYAFIDD